MALLVFVVLPLAALLLEILLFLVLLVLLSAGRFLLGRPWPIEATRAGGGAVLRYEVSGWRASRAAMREIAAGLERGDRAPVPLGLAPPVVRTRA